MMDTVAGRGPRTDGSTSAEPDRVIPTIREVESDPACFARDTCGPAGQLVHGNAGWRSLRPMVDVDACTGCLVCYMHCPDGTISRTVPVAIDFDFCKGCGICAVVCRFDALHMVSEKEA